MADTFRVLHSVKYSKKPSYSTLTPTRLYHQIVEDNPEWKDKLSEGWELWKEKNNHDNKNKNSETKKPSVRETKMAEFRNANKQ